MSSLAHISSAASTAFLQEADFADDHVAICCFAHVVDGQKGDTDRGEGFHFDTCAVGYAHGCTRCNTRVFDFKIEFNARNAQRVTHWDEVRRAFGGHDARKARGFQHIAFGDIAPR